MRSRFKLGRPTPALWVSCFVLGLAVGSGVPGATSASRPPAVGRWAGLDAAPIAPPDPVVSVWTGRQLLVFGRVTTSSAGAAGDIERVYVAAAYDTTISRWRRLPSPAFTDGVYGFNAVWTGNEMLVWGQGVRGALNPLTRRWRLLPGSPYHNTGDGAGLVVWTGREMIGWGGGCCADAWNDGVAYDPARNTWRKLAPSPLAGTQTPVGAWTGSELVVIGGKATTNAAAYNPATDTWRKIARAPGSGTNAVWDGREMLVVGGANGYAYTPATNRWRRLPPMGSPRTGAATVWTGRLLLVWGGRTSRIGEDTMPAHGMAYDPKANRWSALPPAPILGRLDPAAVWTGHLMFVWGGRAPDGHPLADGARFVPTVS